jgi:predicted dehydrogenase
VKDELNIGIIGAGGFAAFATTAFLQIPGVQVIAIADIHKAAAESMAKHLNAQAYTDIAKFLMNDEIDLVYIATPPFLHYSQSKLSLLAGKHVICEKPAALKTSEAEELQSLALALDKLYVVNLMQRYNLLYTIVKNIIQQKLLGDFLHGFFENYASDENLHADHWFWEEDKSGGIFIEHGVHFFDMFSGWLGKGKVVSALQLQRPHLPNKIIDRVQVTALYDKGVVNFYHGFDQPIILDRQEMRLQFEKGEITLYGWVPVKMKLHGLLQKEQVDTIKYMMNNFFEVIQNGSDNENKKVRGRFNDIIFNEEITIEYGNLDDKSRRYTEILKLMLQDQWNWIKDKSHVRVIDDKNAVESLKMAEKATGIAQSF